MNTFIWILQGLIAFIFLYSGINKSWLDEKTLVNKGQTGVEGLAPGLIKFIGVSEIFGAIGIILPFALNIYPVLTAISALCLGIIMIPAAIIHYKRSFSEKKEVKKCGFEYCHIFYLPNHSLYEILTKPIHLVQKVS